MLVLKRAIEESIIIDGKIEVKVLGGGEKGGDIRLGITAPRHIPVHRKEIQEAIEAQRKEALV